MCFGKVSYIYLYARDFYEKGLNHSQPFTRTSGMTVFIRYQEDGSITMRSPYSESFVEDFKRSIPWRSRKWHGEEKHWWVDSRFARDAEVLCKDWFEDVTVILYRREDEQRAAPPNSAPPRSYGPWETLGLLPDRHPLVVEAVYKALMKVHHPDLGGDTATAQAINDAYRKLKGGR